MAVVIAKLRATHRAILSLVCTVGRLYVRLGEALEQWASEEISRL